MRFRNTLFSALLAFGLVGVFAHAQDKGQNPDLKNPNEVLFKRGYSEIIYDPEDIPMIWVKCGYKTIWMFPSDEQILRVEIGLRGSALEVKYGRNWMAIRPNQPKLATNVHVATSQGRVYSFDLQEGPPAGREPHKKILLLRPDMELDADGGPSMAAGKPAETAPVQAVVAVQGNPQGMGQGVSLNPNVKMNPSGQGAVITTASGHKVGVPNMGDVPYQDGSSTVLPPTVLVNNPGAPGVEIIRRLDHNYTIKNQKPSSLKVEDVYNDGYRTFVTFNSVVKEAPEFYRVTEGGKRELVQYRLEAAKDSRDKDVFMIPRVIDVGVIRLGEIESIFTWKH